MATRPKPSLTGGSHTLPFEKLAPLEFERLCLWLVRREGYTREEHLGEAGSEQGRDIVAWKDSRRAAFQCKRVKAFTAATAREEIKKLRGLPVEEQPHELVFVVSQAVRVETRNAARKAWGDEATCHFWAGNELDERVKRHPDLLMEFFQLPPEKPQRPSFLHNLPFPSLGPLFQGREEMLTRLRETLEQSPSGRATAIAGKAVHGLGGVGKTRLAVEYAWRHAAEYSALLFVGAESPADLRRNLAALCERNVLDLPEQQAKEEEVREAAVLRWLGANSGWLLILDNVDSDDAAEAVDALGSRLHGGHLLLTGRLARWSAEVEPIELDVLTEEAAIGFLLKRTQGRRRATKEDANDALTLACELGFLPLALEQASAYISERRLTFAAYLREWQSRHEDVLTWFDPRVSHYPASVAVTWQTSFDRLSAPGRRLLERLAWLGPGPIPEFLLDVPVPDLPEPEPPPHAALVELATYSLVTRAAETPTFAVHRLVQDITRRSLRNVPTDVSLNQALRWVNDAFVGDPGDVRNWHILDPLTPHARAVGSFADAAGLADPTARLMNDLGVLLLTKALVAEAEPLIRRALDIDEKRFGPGHSNIAIRLNNLAQLLQDTNRLAEAEPLMRRALDIDEKNFGPEHPNIARDLNNLARLLHDTNHLDEAEPLMRQALDINEKSLGPEHPYVAILLNNLSLLLQDTNRLAEAEPLIRRALDINEKSFGPEHPDVASCLNNLARLLHATNRLAEAEPLMPWMLAILLDFARRTGHDHPHLQTAIGNYAGLLRDMGRSETEIEEAIEALVRSPG
ncbi:MAG TPA: tetratricopeptide repeat protein [Thermoanaerobaculia bacterium]|nr:tetratricopeptide repeat protein [Thermoanaerobaculia bacterium]